MAKQTNTTVLNKLMGTPTTLFNRRGLYNVGHFYVIESIANRKNGFALEQIQHSDGHPKTILGVTKTEEELAARITDLMAGITIGRSLGRDEEYARWSKLDLNVKNGW